MEIKIKKLNAKAIIPTRGSEDAAGYDLYANIADKDYVVIPPHSTRKIGTGLCVELPKETFAGIFARSGLSMKNGLRPSNCVGVIDSDYRGEIAVALHNDTDSVQIITPQERIAQMVLLPFISMNFIQTDDLSSTERGTGGFGSTGNK